MVDKETVMEMYTRFTHITNELKSLGKSFNMKLLVRKIHDFCLNHGKKGHGHPRGKKYERNFLRQAYR